MKTRLTSRNAPRGLCKRFRAQRFVGAALTLALTGCSVDDRQPTTTSASPATPASSAPDTRGAELANEGTSPPMGSAPPPASASEGVQPTELATPPAGGGSGEASPSTPQPGAEAQEPDPDPGAEVPGAGGMPSAVPSAGCGKARTLQDGNRTIMSGGMNRQYFLETPDDYDSAFAYRVVFMFHWNYGSINAIVNPPDADRNTDRPFYGMGDLTDGKTIFVVPQGLTAAGGGAGWPNPNNRDVDFTDAMLDAISSDLCIDTSRVFTTGFSYGAGMSVALACVRPDKFRAAIVYEPGFISGVNAGQCTTPIAFFQSHGVDDQVLNYQTGLSVLNTFTAMNGCTAPPPPNPPQNGHTCISYENCSVPTRFCNFGAGEGNPFNTGLRGHYPTAKDPGQTTSWIPAEAWDFITQF